MATDVTVIPNTTQYTLLRFFTDVDDATFIDELFIVGWLVERPAAAHVERYPTPVPLVVEGLTRVYCLVDRVRGTWIFPENRTCTTEEEARQHGISEARKWMEIEKTEDEKQSVRPPA